MTIRPIITSTFLLLSEIMMDIAELPKHLISHGEMHFQLLEEIIGEKIAPERKDLILGAKTDDKFSRAAFKQKLMISFQE